MSVLKYDVFLSFRGEDTRDNFTSHLHKELCRQDIETFIDYRIERGDEVSPALNNAIENSTIYVVILSKHYASSSWCLDELTKILKCKETYGREVIPVFYKVAPSNVRHQSQTYADDLAKHHQRFGDKVDAWKTALTQVAGISGWDSQETSPESTLAEKIAEDILKKLNRHVSSDYYKGMTGIGMHTEKIQSLLQLESLTVRIIGIWGIGGIGKTTIANAIYEKLKTQFKSKSIVLNVQQEIERFGPTKVRKQYLSQLLGKDTGIDESNISNNVRKLKRTKGLIVFDDVKDADQLEYLLYGTHDNFAVGSRIIVTSRDKQVLLNANANEIYQITEMDDQHSLQLFCSFAFKQTHPIESYASLAKQVLDYAQGLPLALKVLGLLLYNKSMEVWESQLEKLKKLPDQNIFKSLKLSYDGLDEEEKDIFLDIACFYRGELKKVVELTLNICGFSAKVGMAALKDRCLITISEGKVWMHDLIQEMGHEIVRLQDKDTGKRSRLWKSDDICNVLKGNKGTDAIRCIFLDMDGIKEVQLHPKTFKKMHNLRVIRFHSKYTKSKVVILRPFLESLPDGLKLLYWHCFPQSSLQKDFCPKNLLILDMPYSDLEKLWEEDQALPNLKRLNLSYSKKLRRIPDLFFFPNIEEVILSDCVSLTQVHSSGFLNKLNWLCLDGCISLQSLDIRSNILSRSSGLVALHGCHNLQTLSINSGTDVVQSYGLPPINPDITVHVFDHEMSFCCVDGDGDCDCMDGDSNCNCAEGDAFWILLEDIDTYYNDELCWLDVSNCESLTCLPPELLNLKFLSRLSLSGCLKLEKLPKIEETVENLKVLILDKTSIKDLPSSLDRLVGLNELSLQSCTKLKTIPSSIENLSKLLELNLAYCESLETFPNSIFKMLNLQILNFQGCSMLRNFPDIPNDIGQFSWLTELSLQESGIVNLPESIALLSRLRSLNLSDCKWLECIPMLPPHLQKLLAFDCPSIKTVGKNSRLILMSSSNILEFHLTNTQQLDADSWCNIGNEAMMMSMSNCFAYYSVIFCFPGSTIPSWFPYQCHGHPVIMNTCDPYWWGKKTLVRFALCAVLEPEGIDDTTTEKRTELRYTIRFESNGQTHFLPNENGYFFNSEVRKRSFVHDHTFIWLYDFTLGDLSKISHADNFTIEIKATDYYLEWVRDEEDDYFLKQTWKPNSQSTVKVKECGICPLFS